MKSLPALAALALLATACDRQLQTEPKDLIPAERQIVDAGTARASLAGAYDALQSLSYYGRTIEVLGDLPADNAGHRGTFQYLGAIDRNQVQADNTAVGSLWGAIYTSVARANTIIARVPAIAMDTTERNEILGEAYFLRALDFHNLVKFWGDVPTPLTPVTSADDAAKAVRTPKAQVYTQILSDLAQAEKLITNKTQTRQASLGAVRALRARVKLYMADYAGALADADAVLAMGYSLAPNFADLFTADGSNTPEDIFRVTFTPQEYNEIGYYYLRAGRSEVTATPNLNAVFDTSSMAGPTDLRKALTLATARSGQFQGKKYPTTIGGEDVHVIRLAEVILIRAEALARRNGTGDLALAVAAYNRIRVRAGLAPHTLGVDVTTQADVLAAIDRERRLELALEGDRWPDLVRTGKAASVLGLAADRTFQLLFPIPSSEIIVAPGLTQNPGY